MIFIVNKLKKIAAYASIIIDSDSETKKYHFNSKMPEIEPESVQYL